MPINIAEKVAWGEGARAPGQWARARFCRWLSDTLNDPAGPYVVPLGLRVVPPFSADAPQRKAVVTDNVAIARRLYAQKTSPPVVLVRSGTESDWILSGRKIEGVWYDGKRYNLTFNLDMGIKDAVPTDIDVKREERDDLMLASFVNDAVRDGYDQLGQIGLNHAILRPDDAGNGRHPHKMSFFVIALDNWAPPIP